jgi:hypothetical protein
MFNDEVEEKKTFLKKDKKKHKSIRLTRKTHVMKLR